MLRERGETFKLFYCFFSFRGVCNMKKILAIVSVIAMLLFLVGCGNEIAEEMAEQQMEAEMGENVDVEIESSGFDSDEWCQEGAQWSYTATAPGAGGSNAQWNIVGLVESGQYEGLCHVLYVAEGPDGNAEMNYYFSEDGESGYFEMDINGQKMVSSWGLE